MNVYTKYNSKISISLILFLLFCHPKIVHCDESFGDGGPATEASFKVPWDIFVDESEDIYITDFGDHRVRKISSSGIISTVAGNGFQGESESGISAIDASLNAPTNLYVDESDCIYFLDSGNRRIIKIDPIGNIEKVEARYQFTVESTNKTYTNFLSPRTFILNPIGDTLLIVGGNRLYKKAKNDSLFSTVDVTRQPPEEEFENFDFLYPMAMAINSNNEIYIVETTRHLVSKIDPSGILTTVVGTGEAGFGKEGIAGTVSMLNIPSDVCVDIEGNIYIADTRNHRIIKIDQLGILTTVAGTGKSGFDGDGGLATQAKLNHPRGIFVTENKEIYIADTNNGLIRKVDSQGIITTLAGGGSLSYREPDNLLISEVFFDPEGRDTGKEWIEIYNPTDKSVDITGWDIKYKSGVKTILDSYTISAKETIVIAQDAAMFFEEYGFQPTLEGLNLSSSFSFTNAFDFIQFRDLSNVIIDEITWGNYNEGTYIWNLVTESGTSIARIPTNQDLDQVFDWVSNSVPTPGRPIFSLDELTPGVLVLENLYKIQYEVTDNILNLIVTIPNTETAGNFSHIKELGIQFGSNAAQLNLDQAKIFYTLSNSEVWMPFQKTTEDNAVVGLIEQALFEKYKVLVPAVGTVETILDGLNAFFKYIDDKRPHTVKPDILEIKEGENVIYIPIDPLEELISFDLVNNALNGIRVEFPVTEGFVSEFFLKFAVGQFSFDDAIPTGKIVYGVEIIEGESPVLKKQHRMGLFSLNNNVEVPIDTENSDIGIFDAKVFKTDSPSDKPLSNQSATAELTIRNVGRIEWSEQKLSVKLSVVDVKGEGPDDLLLLKINERDTQRESEVYSFEVDIPSIRVNESATIRIEDIVFTLPDNSDKLNISLNSTSSRNIVDGNDTNDWFTIYPFSIQAPQADFDGDGNIGLSDFISFAGHFGATQGSPNFDSKFDLNGDGNIGLSDFLVFVSRFNK